MAFYLSPLVDINEIDLTTTVTAAATAVAAIVLRNTYKGPENKQTLITTTDDLINNFGRPTDTASCYQDILAASGYLKYGNELYCTRTMPTSATFAGTQAASGAEATFTQFSTANAYILSDFASEDPDEFATDVTVTGSTPMYFIAASRGAWGNNIRVAVADYSTYSEITTGGNSSWNTYSRFAGIDSPLDDAKDFIVVVEENEQEDSSGVWTLKEVHNCSTLTTRLDDQGYKKFVENVINENSNYIRVSFNPGFEDEDITISTSSYQVFAGGQDNNGDSLADASIITAYELYQNSEEIDINIFIDGAKSDTVKSAIIGICETRKDAMAVLDCAYSDVVNNAGNESTDLRTWRRVTFNENTSYACVYGNWLEIYDKWNQKYRWIPSSGHAAGIFANNDATTESWFAPAGLNRALLTNVRKLAWNPSQVNRDILYKNGINPIVSFSGQGKVVWGQKTLLDKNSAFNRINVRRLFMVLEKSISTAVKYFLFEPNDPLTRLSLINMIDPFLRDVQSRRGVYEYSVVCDDSNNTAERIDRNELWVDIYIRPTRAAEFIVLNFIATKTGAAFTEIADMRA